MDFVEHLAVTVHHDTHHTVAERQGVGLADDAAGLGGEVVDVHDLEAVLQEVVTVEHLFQQDHHVAELEEEAYHDRVEMEEEDEQQIEDSQVMAILLKLVVDEHFRQQEVEEDCHEHQVVWDVALEVEVVASSLDAVGKEIEEWVEVSVLEGEEVSVLQEEGQAKLSGNHRVEVKQVSVKQEEGLVSEQEA